MRHFFGPAARAVALAGMAGMLALGHARAEEPLRVYAAGSLSAAFSEMVAKFPGEPGAVAPPVFGPSGVLRANIEGGAAADILASADMAQPEKLATERGGRPVVMFTRNRMCALARPALGLTAENMLKKLLDPKTRLATSTPGADPGGDYAWAVFSRADLVHPGAKAILEAKAQKLVGGADSSSARCRAWCRWRRRPI
jgi:ABC-type molybdate transport system substrate-binding protein